MTRFERLAWCALGCGLAVVLGSNLAGMHGAWLTKGVFNAVCILATILCLTAWRSGEAWLVLAVGAVLYTAGSVYFIFALAGHPPPSPHAADGLWVAFYPCAYLALGLLARGRTRRTHNPGMWLDGIVMALALGALGAAVLLEPVVRRTHGTLGQSAMNLVYPTGDLLLLALVLGTWSLARRGSTLTYALLGLAFGGLAVADVSYVFQTGAWGANGPQGTLSVLYPLAFALMALAARAPARAEESALADRWQLLLLPSAFGLVAIGVLVSDHFRSCGIVALGLAAASLTLALIRLVHAFARTMRLQEVEQEALTDSLTGLGNRRRFVADLERCCAAATEESPRTLVIFDLDGFKQFNDTYGHADGDLLLARLGLRFAEAVRVHGTAYRLGGDEFCSLVEGSPHAVARVVERALEALAEQTESCDISAAHGMVAIPHEVAGADEALKLADARMYAEKDRRRASTRRQTRDLLLKVLDEQQPELHDHSSGVADLARAVAVRLGMTSHEVEWVASAAELHDVGKVAVPEAVLRKPGPLDEDEWAVMRQHTIVGERILSAAPALLPSARLVRASHERWDGAGYPDGLAGEAIPLGARIVSVCDAYDAMTTDRPYRAATTKEAALAELRRCAGTQFDPAVVSALEAVLEHEAVEAPVRPRRPVRSALLGGGEHPLLPVVRLRGLLEVTRLVRDREDLDSLLDKIARTIGESLGFRSVVINLYRPEWDDFLVTTVHGRDEARAQLLATSTSWDTLTPLLDDRFLTRGAYLIRAGEYDWSGTNVFTPPGAAFDDEPDAWHPEDALIVPMAAADERLLGVLWLDEPVSERRPSDDELDVLVAAAGHVALAIRAAQEAVRSARHEASLAHLLQISARLLDTLDVDEILRAVCEGITGALGFQRVLAMMRDTLTGELVTRAAVGCDDGADPSGDFGGTVDGLRPLLDPAFELEGCYLIPHEQATERLGRTDFNHPSTLNGQGPNAWNRHWLIVPLYGLRGEVAGAIFADDPLDRLKPTREQVQALRVFANQATAALNSASQLMSLRFLAEHDSLTGLRNRHAFLNALASECARAQRYGKGFALVLADLDGFETINRVHGQDAGDVALERSAGAISSVLRRSDAAFRVGGDEFALLLVETDGSGAREVVERISAALIERDACPASFGVALYPHDARTADDLHALARLALARSKGDRDELARNAA